MNVLLAPAQFDEYSEYFDEKGQKITYFTVKAIDVVDLGLCHHLHGTAIILSRIVRINDEQLTPEYFLNLPLWKFREFADRIKM